MIKQGGSISTANRNIFICGIDAVKEKNLHQIRGLQQKGYRFVVLTTDSTGCSKKVVRDDPAVRLYISRKKNVFLSMLKLTVHILWRHRPAVAEIYPYSHFSFIAALLCKVAGIPVLIVARGEELKYVEGGMTAVRRLFFRGTYALADGVIYKELYMPVMLDGMRKRIRWHVPNSIKLPDIVHKDGRKSCVFLYMNTMKPFRHPEVCLEAFIRMCEKQGLNGKSDTRLIIAGLSGTVSSPETHAKEKRLKEMVMGRDLPVELHNWTDDPERYFQMADVFLLPADIVYVNYALLEAMGRGIPAIIMDAPGATILIEHGSDGYIEGANPEAWERRMSELALNAELRTQLGCAAREKVARDFEYETYVSRYSHIYDYCINKDVDCPPESLNTRVVPSENARIS